MDINNLLDIMKLAEETIWSKFGVDDGGGDYIDDLTGHKWSMQDDNDISVVVDNDEYSFEVYGTSVWKCDDFTIAKIYDGGGGMYCILMSNNNRISEDEFIDLVDLIEEQKTKGE